MDGFLAFIQTSLTLSIAGISLVYICVQRATLIYKEQISTKNQSSRTYLCQLIGTHNSNQNIIMLPFAILLAIVLYVVHVLTNKENKSRTLSFPTIVNPFQKSNRFYTLIVFAIISNQLIT